MATYVKDKSAAFKKTGDGTALPNKQRSEARMKAYTSATDARAWVNNVTDNKQYIVDLIGTELPKQNPLGKYVPVEVLMKTLMSNKDADIKRLNGIIKEMERFINTLHLNAQEMMHYNKLKDSWAVGDRPSCTTDESLRSSIPLSESKYGRTSSEDRLRRPPSIQTSPRTASESRIATPRSEPMQTSASESDSGKPDHHQRTPIRLHADKHYSSGSTESYTTAQSKFASEFSTGESLTTRSTVPLVRVLPLKVNSHHKDVQVSHSVESTESQTQTAKPKEMVMVDRAQQVVYEGTQLKLKSSSALKSRIPVPGPTGDMKVGKITQTPIISSHDIQTVFDAFTADKQMTTTAYEKCFECERNLLTIRQTMDQMEELKITLEERDDKLQAMQCELDKMKADVLDQENIDDDISTMANHIAKLRASGSTDELKIVSSELQLLKKYCQKLIYIKSDNKKLKHENDNLRSQLNISRSIGTLKKSHYTLVSIEPNTCLRRDDYSGDVDLRNKLQTKCIALREVTKQRDKLQATISKLEAKLKKYDHLNNEITIFKERSKVLDTVIEEKLGLERRLHRLGNLETEMMSLKVRANKADELQRALENAQSKLLQMHSQRSSFLNTSFSRDGNSNSMTALMEDLKYKTREAEVLRVDRDRMRVRLEELSHFEHEYKLLQGKVRTLEAVRNERDAYKSKTMELASLQDDYVLLREQAEQVQILTDERDTLIRKVHDLECVITDQENEINRLVMHIDRLSRGADKHQDRIKEIITELRGEIESKNLLISNSETQLADVQEQLKHTIDTLTKETCALKQQVSAANASCTVFKNRLERLSKQLTETTVAFEKEKKTCVRFKAEVVALSRDNQRLQEIADNMNALTDAGKLKSILDKSHAASETAAIQLSDSETVMSRAVNTESVTHIRPLARSIHTTVASTEYADSRGQISSLLTGIKNIPTHDYSVVKQQTDQGIVVEHSVDAINLPSPPSGSIRLEEKAVQFALSAQASEDKDDKVVCTKSRTPPCRINVDSSTICVDNSDDFLHLQQLQDEGKLSLEGISCVCRGIQADICECVGPTQQQILAHSEKMISVDNALDMKGRKLEKRDKLSLENITCVCEGSRAKICSCSISDELRTPRTTEGYIPPCRRGLQVDANTICVDNEDEQRRLQNLEYEGNLSLTNIKCVCKRTQTAVCVCKSASMPGFTAESSSLKEKKVGKKVPPCRRGSNVHSDTICVDNSEDQSRLEKLEFEGKLSLDNIRCVCKGTQVEVCDCTDSGTGLDQKRISKGRRGSDILLSTICVDNIDDQRRIQKLEDKGKLSLDNIRCVCRGTQAEICECLDSKTNLKKKKVSPCRKDSNDLYDSICVDNTKDQLRLQQLENAGKLSLDNVRCVCRGTQAEICECPDLEIRRKEEDQIQRKDQNQQLRQQEAEEKLSLDNIRCVCRSTQAEICECSDLEIQRKDQDQIQRKDKDQHLRQQEDEEKLSLGNIRCMCRGIQTEICECPDLEIQRKEKDQIQSKDQDQHLRQQEDEEKMPVDYIRCACKGIQATGKLSEQNMNIDEQPLQHLVSEDKIALASIKSGTMSISKDIDTGSKLKAELLQKERDMIELKKQRDTIGLENQALRKHASEIKNIAKSQISALSNELRKSREDWAKTDDSKTVADLQEQNKLLQKELSMLRKLQCECNQVYKEKLLESSVKLKIPKDESQLPKLKYKKLEDEVKFSRANILCVCKEVQTEVCECADGDLISSESKQKASPVLQGKSLLGDKRSVSQKGTDGGISEHPSERGLYMEDMRPIESTKYSVLPSESKKPSEYYIEKQKHPEETRTRDSERILAPSESIKVQKYPSEIGKHFDETKPFDRDLDVVSATEKKRSQEHPSETKKYPDEVKPSEDTRLEKHPSKIGKLPEGIKPTESHEFLDRHAELENYSERAKPKPDKETLLEKPIHTDELEQKMHMEKDAAKVDKVIEESKKGESPVSGHPKLQDRQSEIKKHPEAAAAEIKPTLSHEPKTSETKEPLKSSSEIKHPVLKETTKDRPTYQPLQAAAESIYKGVEGKEREKPIVVEKIEDKRPLAQSPEVKHPEQVTEAAEGKPVKQRSQVMGEPKLHKDVEEMVIEAPIEKRKSVLPSMAVQDPSRAIEGTLPKEILDLSPEMKRHELKEPPGTASLPKSPSNSDLMRELDKLRKQLDESKAENASKPSDKKDDDKLLKELEDLRKQLENCKSEIGDYKAQLGDKSEQQKQFGDEKQSGEAAPALTKENADLKKQLDALKEQLAEKPEKKEPKESDYLTQENNDLKNQLVQMKKALDQAKTLQELPIKDGKQDPGKGMPDDWSKQLENCTNELDDLRKQLENCRKDLEAQKKLSPIESARKEDFKSENDELQKQLEDLKKQLAKEKEMAIKAPPVAIDLKPENDDLRKQLEDLKKQLAETKNDLEKERSTPKGDSSDIDDLKRQLEALKNQLNEANKKLEECEQHLENEKKKLEEEKNKRLSALTVAPADNKQEMDDLLKQLADAKKQLDEERKKPMDTKLPEVAAAPTGPSQKDYDDLLAQLKQSQAALDSEKKKIPPPTMQAQQDAASTLKTQPQTVKEDAQEKPTIAQIAKEQPIEIEKPTTVAGLQDTKGQPDEKPSTVAGLQGTKGQPDEKLSTVAGLQGTKGQPDEKPSTVAGLQGTKGQPDEKLSTVAGLQGTKGQPDEKPSTVAGLQGTKGQPDEKPSTVAGLQGTKGQPDENLSTVAGLQDTKGQPDEKPSTVAGLQGTKGHPNEKPTTASALQGTKSQPDEKPTTASALQGTKGQSDEKPSIAPTTASATKEGQLTAKPTAQQAAKKQASTKGPTAQTASGKPGEKPSTAPKTAAKTKQEQLTGKPTSQQARKEQVSTAGLTAQTGKGQPVEKSSTAPTTAAQAKQEQLTEKPNSGTTRQEDKEPSKEPTSEAPVTLDTQPKILEETVETATVHDSKTKLSSRASQTAAYDLSSTPAITQKTKPIEGLTADEAFRKTGEKPTAPTVAGPSTEAAKLENYKKRLADSQQRNLEQKLLLKESKMKLQQLEIELEKTKKQSIEAIKSARASYERDIMSMQQSYIEGIETLQASHEELMSQGNAEMEAEVESLRKDAVQKQAKIDELRCICYDLKKKKTNLCQVQVQAMDIQMECVCDDMLFAYLLRKILYCGLETLTFEDLQYMHTKICDATAKVMSSAKMSDYSFEPCSPCNPCDYRCRQTKAQTQVAKLQMEVALERQRLESLKKALDIERSTQASMAHHYQRQAKIYAPVYGAYQAQTARRYSTIDDNCRCLSEVDLNLRRRTHLDSVQEHQSSTVLKY